MSEGLLVSFAGMAAVFVALGVMMFLMMAMGRVLGRGEVAVEEVVGAGGVEAKVEVGAGPRDAVEVAAIALALASYMKDRGKELRGGRMSIGGVEYQVELGDLSRPPVAVVVNGESYWASVDGEGLPVAGQIASMLGTRMREAPRGQSWRSAYPLAQGSSWDRRGWSGRT